MAYEKPLWLSKPSSTFTSKRWTEKTQLATRYIWNLLNRSRKWTGKSERETYSVEETGRRQTDDKNYWDLSKVMICRLAKMWWTGQKKLKGRLKLTTYILCIWHVATQGRNRVMCFILRILVQLYEQEDSYRGKPKLCCVVILCLPRKELNIGDILV